MDSLTAMLMTTSGLSRANSLLPPENNVRMVHLKKPFEKADIALHEARVALKNVEDKTGTAHQLYTAMAKRQTSETYFSTRCFGRDGSILKGREDKTGQEKLRSTSKKLMTMAKTRINTDSSLDHDAQHAAIVCLAACQSLEAIADMWYANPTDTVRRRQSLTPVFGNYPQAINGYIADVKIDLATAQAVAVDQASIDSIHEPLRDALVCKRLADTIQLGKWDFV